MFVMCLHCVVSLIINAISLLYCIRHDYVIFEAVLTINILVNIYISYRIITNE